MTMRDRVSVLDRVQGGVTATLSDGTKCIGVVTVGLHIIIVASYYHTSQILSPSKRKL